MRILANENVAGAIVTALQRLGHDVAWIASDAPGATDEAVLRRAAAEDRIVLTFDKDFGQLAFRKGLPHSTGVILVRTQARDSATLTEVVVAALQSRDGWAGHFSVVGDRAVRMTPLPQAPGQG